ncbi:Hypothetical predicted protein [Paramuricea clavata]|uniref:Uncharacterized protein n=1 Tax=Paramuricea clavata TaxID=317549 RepID=A0A6S7HZA6_PARCT|nr:Hypothetical predicted protein [Paramuricea clavata]
MDYKKKTFPIDDIIKHAKLANFQLRDGMDFLYVSFFVERYANVLKFSDKDIDLLHDELVDYIILEDTDIPQSVWEEVKLQGNNDDTNAKRIRMDVIVAHLSGMTAPGSNSLQFPQLSRVLQLIIIPHSNA